MKRKPRKPELNEYLGFYLRELREYYGLSQSEVGKYLNVSHAAISDLERGITQISFETLVKIATSIEERKK